MTDAKVQKELVSELIKWYRQFPFPEYQPAGLNLTTTVADSELCKNSVGKWMQATGIGYDDPKRKERCAGVAAGVTKWIVEELNKRLA